MKKEVVHIYTDGACSGNQQKNNFGGWGAVLIFGEQKKEICGGEKNTTNQRMEITACIKALESMKRNDLSIEIFSDSAYVVNCFHQQWYVRWKQNGWRNAKKEPVENRDLWEQLLLLVEKYDVTFSKVLGHSGHQYNERADALARKGAQEIQAN